MALSIGVKKGSGVRIGEFLMEVLEIVPDRAVTVLFRGKRMDLTDRQRTELFPEVFVSYGRNPNRSNPPGNLAPSARLAFEAPRSVQITRQ